MLRKKLKTITVALLSFVLLFGFSPNIVWAETIQTDSLKTSELENCTENEIEEGKKIINTYFDAVNNKNWNEFQKLVSVDSKDFFKSYFKDENENEGIKQIDKVKIKNIYYIKDKALADKYYLKNEYNFSEHTVPFIAEIDCSVSKENQYFYNGINYLLIVLSKESNELKVLQTNRPSNELMEKVVKKALISENLLSEERSKAINAVETCNNGLLVNSKGTLIKGDFKVAKIDSNDKNIQLKSSNSTHYTTCSYSYYIRVKLNKTGNNQIKKVSMPEYIKCTLPNEWMASWPKNSLIAGAYCVKMDGIYDTIHPVSSTGGYDATQSTQNYIPGKDNSITNAIVNNLVNCGMADTNGFIFFARYGAGTSGQTGSKGSGLLLQYGSKKLAENGYSYSQILNYYYSGSNVSSGNVNLFGYNIGF